MKKEQKILPVTKNDKTGSKTNAVNKTKKTSTAASINNAMTSAVGKTIARTGSGLANEGTSVSYEEER